MLINPYPFSCHSAKIGWAAASQPINGGNIGIDVETIEDARKFLERMVPEQELFLMVLYPLNLSRHWGYSKLFGPSKRPCRALALAERS